MHPEIDRFAHLDSFLHRWDPRWKLAALLILLVSMGIERPGARSAPEFGRDFPPALGALAASVLLTGASRIPLGFVVRRLRAIALLLAIIVIVLPLAHPGARVPLGPLAVAPDGALLGLLIALRASAMVLLVFPAFGTTRFDVTMKALRSLRLPAPLVQIVLFTYRYLFVYADQLRRMQLAMKARGFRAAADRRTLRAIGNGVGVLLVGSIERTQRIYSAMKCRGLSGTFRTFESFRTRPGDLCLFGATLGLAAALFAWRML
jgi:cobalt/nickel transport system permease protein